MNFKFSRLLVIIYETDYFYFIDCRHQNTKSHQQIGHRS